MRSCVCLYVWVCVCVGWCVRQFSTTTTTTLLLCSHVDRTRHTTTWATGALIHTNDLYWCVHETEHCTRYSERSLYSVHRSGRSGRCRSTSLFPSSDNRVRARENMMMLFMCVGLTTWNGAMFCVVKLETTDTFQFCVSLGMSNAINSIQSLLSFDERCCFVVFQLLLLFFTYYIYFELTVCTTWEKNSLILCRNEVEETLRFYFYLLKTMAFHLHSYVFIHYL